MVAGDDRAQTAAKADGRCSGEEKVNKKKANETWLPLKCIVLVNPVLLESGKKKCSPAAVGMFRAASYRLAVESVFFCLFSMLFFVRCRYFYTLADDLAAGKQEAADTDSCAAAPQVQNDFCFVAFFVRTHYFCNNVKI